MIPGSNLLATALRVIAKQTFQYQAFQCRTLNSVGQYEAAYAPATTLAGSVQPVPRNLYQQYGLEFDKYYLKFFVSKNVIDVTRNKSGDLLAFQGNNYQVESVTPWFGIDGWNEVLAVQVPPAPCS